MRVSFAWHMTKLRIERLGLLPYLAPVGARRLGACSILKISQSRQQKLASAKVARITQDAARLPLSGALRRWLVALPS